MEKENETFSIIELFAAQSLLNDNSDIESLILSVAKFYEIHKRHQYSLISQYIFEKREENPDSISYILNNIMQFHAIISRCRSDFEKILTDNNITIPYEELLIKIEKLYDHIALEENRLVNNDKVIIESSNKLQGELIFNFNHMSDNFTEKFDDMTNSQSANTMTIIGLFSAVIFVFFGGITGLSSVIKGIFEIGSKDELKIPLFIICFIGLILFDIVFMLLYSVSKILDKNIGRCVSGERFGKWWYYEDEGCFYICPPAGTERDCSKKENKAKRKCLRKNIKYNIGNFIISVVRIFVCRFPMVFAFNIILIGIMIFILIKL